MSSLIVGSRIVTAEVFALTTNADTHAAARTPRAAARSVSISGPVAQSRRGTLDVTAPEVLAAPACDSPKKR